MSRISTSPLSQIVTFTVGIGHPLTNNNCFFLHKLKIQHYLFCIYVFKNIAREKELRKCQYVTLILGHALCLKTNVYL